MKVRDKNPVLKKIIEDFNRKGHEGKSAGKGPAAGCGVWKALAEGMNRPRRTRFEADIARIEKFAKAKDTIVVPGVVLSKGEVTKPLTVAAVRFSASAKAKIEKAGGKCMDISELDEKSVSRVRIMC
jgi:large subunit ribosomal protein L18e